jgi:type IV secretion system protein VirD4
MTVGVTGSGKGRNAAITQALSFEGSLVCFDPKAEILQVSRRYRETVLNQQTVVLSPFSDETDGLNLFDLLPFVGGAPYDFAQELASHIAGVDQKNSLSRGTSNDDFWTESGVNLLTGVIGAAMDGQFGPPCLPSALDALKVDEVAYSLAVLLEKDKPAKAAYQEIAAFLQMTEVTRSGVLATAQSYLRGLHGDGVTKMLTETTFDLEGFIHGTVPTTIYFVVPPAKFVSHARVVRLIFGALIMALFSRNFIPNLKTLFQIDEAAILGPFAPLRLLLTLGRGQGVICHTFWQDLDQVRNSFFDWHTVVNNHGVIRWLGNSNHHQAVQMSGLFGVSPRRLMEMAPDEQALLIDGKFQRCRRLDYLTDEFFQGRYDTNLRYVDPFSSQVRHDAPTRLPR